MANKRMFTMKIVDSDAFLDMPMSAQCLYFHLNMRADDDGFIGNTKRIMRMIGASGDDLKLLIAKRFLLMFEGGVIVIKHWRMHNALSKNRYHETAYIEEKSMLRLKENGAYSLNSGALIDDGKLIEASIRQSDKTQQCMEDGQKTQHRRNIDEQKTQHRRNKDEQKTHPDLGLDLGLDIDKELDKENHIAGQDPAAGLPFREIIEYLNDRTGSHYRPGTAATKRHIRARLREGFVLEDFFTVIDTMCGEWLEDIRMRKYLRPETLFGTKFESYLNRAPSGTARDRPPVQETRETAEADELVGDDWFTPPPAGHVPP